jgi:hypothetical protein
MSVSVFFVFQVFEFLALAATCRREAERRARGRREGGRKGGWVGGRVGGKEGGRSAAVDVVGFLDECWGRGAIENDESLI